jgi:hypothetical protein
VVWRERSEAADYAFGQGALRAFLFSPAGFHAAIVLGLACRSGVIRHAGFLLVAALLAGVRLLGSRCMDCAAKTKQYQHDDGDGAHEGLLSMLQRRPARQPRH